MDLLEAVWLADEQMVRLRPFFPQSHGKPRIDDRQVPKGMVFLNRIVLLIALTGRKRSELTRSA